VVEERHDRFARAPARLLVEHLAILPRGKALDLAMGFGRNALYLAEHGFEVEGIDIEERCVRHCLDEARRRGLALRAWVADLERHRLAAETYDLVICFYYLERALIAQIKKALRAGGVVLFETFLVDQHLRYGKPRHRQYCLERNELLHLFDDFRVLYYREGWRSADRATASIVARKPGSVDPLA